MSSASRPVAVTINWIGGLGPLSSENKVSRNEFALEGATREILDLSRLD